MGSPGPVLSMSMPMSTPAGTPGGASFMTQAARKRSLGGPASPLADKRSRSGETAAADLQQQGDGATVPEDEARASSHAAAAHSGGAAAPGLSVPTEIVAAADLPAALSAAAADEPVLSVFSSLRGHGEPAGPPAERHSTDSEDTEHRTNDENAAVDHTSVALRQAQQGPSHHAHHPPPPEVPEAAESELEEESDGGEMLCEFDPILFIKSLPPLDSVVREPRLPLLPKQTRTCKQKTLVLDLDETLVHSSLEPVGNCDFSFCVHFNSMEHMIHVRKRPFLELFMERVSQLFEIVVFTASQKIYAEKLLNIIDPQRTLIKHRIYRDSCVVVDGNYLKDLTVLGRDLSHTIIVDNSPQAFGFQIDNGVPIESWYDDDSDSELVKLLPFLEALVDVDDVRPSIAQKFRLRELVARA